MKIGPWHFGSHASMSKPDVGVMTLGFSIVHKKLEMATYHPPHGEYHVHVPPARWEDVARAKSELEVLEAAGPDSVIHLCSSSEVSLPRDARRRLREGRQWSDEEPARSET